MNRRVAFVLGFVAVGAVLALLLSRLGGDDRYEVTIPVPNASGLRDGSAVKVGGVDRGTVKLSIDRRDNVLLTLKLDRSVGRVGKDAKVAIVAANFLGIKRVELLRGDATGNPAPDGYRLPASQLTTPTDLDQVLGVFDADTRARARILLDAAGEAVVGRKVDVSTLLRELPVGMQQAGPVLQQLATDDRTMDSLLARSDRFVAQVTAERRALSRLVDTLGQASATVAARRAALRQTLAAAPATLRDLRGFLGDLEDATGDLGPAARDITAAAPALRDTLAQVDEVQTAAAPALRSATAAAPQLTKLATGATPTLRRLRPTLQAAATLASDLPPVSDTLDHSADNVIAILENWSRAIQFRDSMGHVFRGEASFSPDLILSMVGRLTAPAKKKAAGPARRRPALPTVLDKLPKLQAARPQAATKPKAQQLVEGVGEKVGSLLDKVLGAGRQPDGDQDRQGLLDFLLKP